MTPPTRPRDPFMSARLIYRAIRVPEDDALFAAINDDRVGYMNSNASNVKLPTPSDATKFREKCAEELLAAVICLPASEEPSKPGTSIGQIHLKGFPPRFMHHRNTEIGLDILPQWQGKGYGSETINWALEYAFLKVGLHKVRIRAFGWNEGAMRLYERLGFKLEGREREALWHEGRFWDGIEYGMIDREWWEMRGKDRDFGL
ncbi:acyl-CoA N-acyltransferase [Lentithecium fluviatile CBS 122367]|uniref:Acyl-CoA N-acyltransferase n=1 Tax=Lentithecium fluviatile CBS 122367 TaxID=1168545 RepID=A0A6G1IYJ0_9PLEO|nr:acyl-CoA N-acyltransferase [Lentithecium fluviatile CBS 122367]